MKLIALHIVFLIAAVQADCSGPRTADQKAAENAPQQGTPTVGLNLGNRAPEITLSNWNDSLMPLSSIKGKIVLIDFWASWCGPCRYENPAVAEAYLQYRDKKFKGGDGFTVYSVSLDTDRSRWKAAVQKDGLVWPYHVSDLKSWNSPVVLKYNIDGIPANFLINSSGVIIDKNLRGDKLLQALKKQLVNE